MRIGDVISKKRKELNMTLDDVAHAVGVSKATVSRWESGDIRKMKRDKISALSSVLDLDPLLFLNEPEILTSDESRILSAYRKASPDCRKAALLILENSASENQEKGTSFESTATDHTA